MDGISINKAYKPLYTSDKRYFFITGGRGSLKSTTVHDYISRLTFEKGHGILFTRYTMTSAEKSIIPEFRLAIERNKSTQHFEITKNKITNLLTGSFILFSGIKTSSGNQTANLKSIAGITTWVIEEGEDFIDEKAFDDIDNSIRTTSKQNRIIWVMNPSTCEHFIYKRWIDQRFSLEKLGNYEVKKSTHPKVEHIHTWYKIAEKYLSKDWIEKAEELEENNPDKYYHTYVGGWLDKAEGVIFEHFETIEFDNSLPYIYGLDFGSRDPDALVKIAIDKKTNRLYLKEELYQNGLSTDELSNIVRNIAGKKLIIADSANPRTIQDLSKYCNIQKCKKGEGSILEGIKTMRNYTICVDPSSYNLITELNNYVWSDRQGEIPIDDYNHMIDAARYATSHLSKPKQSIWA